MGCEKVKKIIKFKDEVIEFDTENVKDIKITRYANIEYKGFGNSFGSFATEDKTNKVLEEIINFINNDEQEELIVIEE